MNILLNENNCKTTGYSAYDAQNESELTGVALANVEALAQNESENETTCRWERVFDNKGCAYHACLENGSGSICSPCGSTEG